MALSILSYDVWAIKSQKAETLSSAIWRSLEHPTKHIALLSSWGILTYHLFFNRPARKSMSVALNAFKRIIQE